MTEADGSRYLRIALVAVGVTFIVGIYGLITVWPSGWSWHAGQSHSLPHYLQMILGVYATLGVFLLIASRNPLAHLSLIWFTVWSSVVHAGIMAAQALANREQIAHLWGDVPALLVLAAILAFLTRRATVAQEHREPNPRRQLPTAFHPQRKRSYNIKETEMHYHDSDDLKRLAGLSRLVRRNFPFLSSSTRPSAGTMASSPGSIAN